LVGAANINNNVNTRISGGNLEIEDNDIQSALKCSDNTKVVNQGFKNHVAGQEKGDCAGL